MIGIVRLIQAGQVATARNACAAAAAAAVLRQHSITVSSDSLSVGVGILAGRVHVCRQRSLASTRLRGFVG